MTDNVIKLKKVQYIWRCNCGCTTFELGEWGVITCASCEKENTTPEHEGWRESFPPAPYEAPKLDDKDTKITTMETSTSSLQRVINELQKELDTNGTEQLNQLIRIWNNGVVSVWGPDVEGKARTAWMRKRLNDAARVMFKKGKE